MLHADHYAIARLIVQRGMGVVYLVAFIVTLEQFRPLCGERGLLPVPSFLERVSFRDAPSLFHVRYTDRLLTLVSAAGAVLSVVVMLGLPDRWPIAAGMAIWLTLWALYLSIVNVGQRFYGFGWESLLLEAGFLTAFLGPSWCAVPAPIMWAFWWLLVRVELGAGLIKVRGDACWRDFTCLYWHHETQPMPNPLSWWFHNLPKPIHRLEVLGSHVAQLVAPALLFLPQPIAGAAALFMAVTQAWLVLSGNFSWLNALTILLAFSAMDDRMLPLARPAADVVVRWHDGVVVVVAVMLILLSYRPARNLVSGNQVMNASFDPLRLVNTYGAFGHVTKERLEIVVEGRGPDGTWKAYEFRGKPTDPKRRPRQWAPYHLRLDWLMWFAALSPTRELVWVERFLRRLLENDAPTLRLLAKNPSPDRPPEDVRAVLYRYRFTTWSERRATGEWWKRTLVRELL